jgi:DNA-binding SARP family transcriptional activator
MGAGTKLHRGSGLAIATLGAVDVTLEGRECNGFGTRKTLALLIYLAFSEVAVERETLAALFWDDVPEENARASLNVAVSQLRKKLPAYIVATRETVSLNRDLPLWIDAEAFARRWRAWQEAQGNAPYMTKPALRSLLETLALYQGHFLDTLAISAGAAFEEWVRFERERLQQMVLRALEEAATAYLHRRQYQRGVTLARRLLQFDPLRESSHQLMMLLLARQGQRNAALAHFEECRLLLNTELGVAPGPDIQALYERICTPTIQCRLPSRPSSTAGRADDLKQIQYRLCMPDCRLLAVTGSAGSGKTHLALEVAWAARDHFLGGVCFVPLAGRRSAASVARSIATALSLHLEETVAVKELLFYTLHNKEILLVLDGFEPQLPACELLAELLGHAPHVKLLVTSRERLEIPDAWHHTLGGLSYPGVAAETKRTLEELAAGYGAVDLFRQEAQKLDIDIADEPQERDAIRRICQLVDGLPLGIQLAAAWLPVLTCPEIAAEVS